MSCKNICFACCATLSMTLGAMNRNTPQWLHTAVQQGRPPMTIGPATLLHNITQHTAQIHNWPHYRNRTANPPAAHPEPAGLIDIGALAQELNASNVSDQEFDRRIIEAEAHNKNLRAQV